MRRQSERVPRARMASAACNPRCAIAPLAYAATAAAVCVNEIGVSILSTLQEFSDMDDDDEEEDEDDDEDEGAHLP